MTDADTGARHQRSPGDLLIHPAALVALVVVLVNDRFLKVHHPGTVSGKLSDFAGLVYFPLFVVSSLECARWLVRRPRWQLRVGVLDVVIAVVGVAFVLIKLWHPAGEVYRTAIGMAYWPFDAIASIVRGDGLPPLYRVLLVEDPWDLMGLVALAIPAWIGHRVMVDPDLVSTDAVAS